MNFRETTAEDLEYLADHSVSRGIQSKCPEQIDYCFTLEHEGKPLCVGGFRLINATTMWIWCDLTDAAGNHIITVYRTISEWLESFAKEHKIIRAQAYIEASFPEAIRMITHLGFHRESVMLNFVELEPAYLYVKFYGVSHDNQNKEE